MSKPVVVRLYATQLCVHELYRQTFEPDPDIQSLQKLFDETHELPVKKMRVRVTLTASHNPSRYRATWQLTLLKANGSVCESEEAETLWSRTDHRFEITTKSKDTGRVKILLGPPSLQEACRMFAANDSETNYVYLLDAIAKHTYDMHGMLQPQVAHIVAKAREYFADDELEIDDRPMISRAKPDTEGGLWVNCWKWLNDADYCTPELFPAYFHVECCQCHQACDTDEAAASYCGSIHPECAAAHAADCDVCYKDFVDRGLIPERDGQEENDKESETRE